jgi:polysaccharide deacetylase family protein (PEP-CTERM system associated)
MLRHAFTVDVEEWFHGIPIGAQRKATFASRIQPALETLLDLLAQHGVRGTFYVLGPVARSHPALLRAIAEAGHEIGCHGWSHDPVYELTPERFTEETQLAQDAITDGIGRPVTAYRAAYFSVTQRSLWALERLAALGFTTDSSVFPVRNWRYGIPGFDPRPRVIPTAAGPIVEAPISVRRVLGRTIPTSGGAYFRIYPYVLTRSNFRAAEREGRPVIFYVHPWELDPDHPRIDFGRKARATHYFNLGSTVPKLRRLLNDFSFAPLEEVLRDALD